MSKERRQGKPQAVADKVQPIVRNNMIIDERKRLVRIYHNESSRKAIDVLALYQLSTVVIDVPAIKLGPDDVDCYIEALRIAKDKAISLRDELQK